MSQQTAGTALRVHSLLNPTQDSEDAESTGGNSKYEPPNAHSLSNEDRGLTASTHITSGSRPTVQPFGPGRSMPATLPTTSIGFMVPLGGSSLVNTSQAMNSPLPAIDDLRQRSRLEQHFMTLSKGQDYNRWTPNLPLALPGLSRTNIDCCNIALSAVHGVSEAHVHPPPTTTLSPQNAHGFKIHPHTPEEKLKELNELHEEKKKWEEKMKEVEEEKKELEEK
ncbi:hypothetical protein B0J15DRAFT_470877 [Fusarium solani]|uniref:Uncharacterized protein n=1 Tax=Fusarium solani TaxID=169388 RepID=A0A9P9GFZ7_FUSSL|nr:uncharacterized protein B0J15DRAFT_470877 [Fusarium solani]KAH7237845.1 hypothetical protein B0J15DRAFT_470877 [Fusarium solani]